MFFKSNPSIPPHWASLYKALADDIRARARGRKILLVSHKGNWGDALIVQGARNFLRWHGFGFIELRGSRAIGRDMAKTRAQYPPDQFYPVFTAGGSISPLYGHSAKLAQASQAYEGGTILPATCGLPAQSIGLHPECTLWVRERGESAANHPSGRFCHDMAFFSPAYRFPKLRGEGIFMRRDRERPAGARDEGIDLSEFGSDRSPVWPFFAIVGSHRKIRTNRLHVAIASAICGVSCELSQGATSKISDVHAASLAEYGQTVTLMRD
ncbi:hypothetical protein PVT71_17830 [Salipiger sp. H15]|uniref:Polysaccharide pyruvyl transferase domain-containing protein n=1 Tax=Alloyangia sp. H15 TaxID=3029062 RepID=A0AAU8AP90_9RHOB